MPADTQTPDHHSPEGWNPQTLAEYTDSEVMGWMLGVLALGMLIWYTRIATRWWRTSKYYDALGGNLWRVLIIIFVVCALAGCGSLVLALFVPKVAVTVQIVFLALQNIICPVFWYHIRNRRFSGVGLYERIGEELHLEIHVSDLTDREIAAWVRCLVVEHTKRNV